MGPMLLLVLGIIGAVGFGLYQFGEQHRFDMVSDSKGGIFILDKKSSTINYCNNQTCSLVGNGALPSHLMGNPAAMASMQGAIMGAPAASGAATPGQAPTGMQSNIAASGNANSDNANAAATPAADSDVHDADADAPAADADHTDVAPDADTPDAAAAPDGFSF